MNTEKLFRLKLIIISLAILGLISCGNQEPELIPLKFEKDLIPEGIAVNGLTKMIYLNSLKSNKIVTSSIDGNNPKTFLETNKYGYLPGFGMTIQGDTLYALGNSLSGDSNKSVLLLLQLSTGDLIESYSINDSNFRYLNDLAITSNNEIFITDSESNKIYKIQRPNKTLEIYLDSEKTPNSNGITISRNSKHLYLATAKGIGIIDIKSKRIVNEPNETFSGIDGLKFYKNNLYGIVNIWVSDTSKNGLFKYVLNESGTEILKKQKIVEFTNDFNTPTTFDIVDGHIFFITNTQLDNYDGATNSVLDLDKLQSYRLMKIKVE